MPRMRKPIVDEELVSYKRIPFGPEIIKNMKCQFIQGKGWTHRRHIISQHFLRSAWNKMAPEICKTPSWLEEVAQAVVQVQGRLPDGQYLVKHGKIKCMQIYASEILRQMNDNPKNLFVEDGGENSGIGSFAHDMEELLEWLADNETDNQQGFKKVKSDVKEYISGKSGSWGKAAKEHYETIKEPALVLIRDAGDWSELVWAVEDLAFSTDFDINKKENSKVLTEKLWRMRNSFYGFVNGTNKSLLEFKELIVDFCS